MKDLIHVGPLVLEIPFVRSFGRRERVPTFMRVEPTDSLGMMVVVIFDKNPEYNMITRPTAGYLLLVLLFFGCSHPGKISQGLRGIEEEIRRNSELMQKYTTSVSVLVALGHAYIEKARFGFNRKADEYSDWSQVGDEDTSVKDLNKAIQVLQGALRLHPENDQVLAQLGYAFVLRSRRMEYSREAERSLADGRRYLQRAIELNPLSSLAHYYQALSYYTPYGGTKKQVISQLETALSLDPTLADAHFLLGGLRGSDSSRGSHYHQAMLAGLSDPLALTRIGRFYEYGGGHDIGMWFTHDALRQVPAFARAVFGLGVMFFLKPDGQKAAELYTRALKIDSLLPLAMARMSNVYWNRGDTLKAVDLYLRSGRESWSLPKEFYEKVIALHPDCARAYIRLVDFALNDDERQLSLLKKAIELDPKSKGGYYKLVELYTKKGTPEKAIEYLEKLSGGSDWETYYGRARLAWLYLWTRQYGKLADLYWHTAAKGRGILLDAAVYDYGFGQKVYRISLDDVRREYAKLMSSDAKSNAIITASLAHATIESGDTTSAMALLERAAKIDASNSDVTTELASRYKERGQVVQALKLYRVLCDSLPEDIDMLYNAGEMLILLGRRGEAEKYFDRIKTLDPFAVEESYDQAQWYSLESRYGVIAYLKAARLGSRAAQDTLKNRHISW